MAIIRCKMCGADLQAVDSSTTCTCEYCGSTQTIPNGNDEKKINLFNRANRLRIACEFDKASSVYESIVSEFPEEAEAYWGLVLCKYGIEYVDDSATGRKIPTCHRASYTSVYDDSDFELACEYADVLSRNLYREEAKNFEFLREKISEISIKESPYDIFICYKDTDDTGERTPDSVVAQDVYDKLVEKGYKVFFSRITLEDKLGEEYEPFIFAALNSAPVMLVLGSRFDYFDAPWVKNEWNRFLKLKEKDKNKHIIPCYMEIDAYDLPQELKNLQAQDMTKIGAIQDLVRGIDKLLENTHISHSEPYHNHEDYQYDNNYSEGGSEIPNLLKRVQGFINSNEWDRAVEYCDRILDLDIENGDAGYYMHLIKNRCHNIEELARLSVDIPYSNFNFPHYLDAACSKHIQEQCEKFDSLAEQYLQEKIKRTENEQKEIILEAMDYVKDKRLVQDEINQRLATVSLRIFVLNEKGVITYSGDRQEDYAEVKQNWKNISQIVCLQSYLVGLFSNNSSVRVFKPIRSTTPNEEKNEYSKISKFVSSWTGVKKLYSNYFSLYAVCYDGRVFSLFFSNNLGATTKNTGQFDVKSLENVDEIIDISFKTGRLICRKKDGYITYTEYKGEPNEDTWGSVIEEIKDWKDIVSLFYLKNRIVGIKKSGDLVATSVTGPAFGSTIEKNDPWDVIQYWKHVISLHEIDARYFALTDYGKILSFSNRDNKVVGLHYFMSEANNVVKLFDRYNMVAYYTANGDVKVNFWGDYNDEATYYNQPAISSWKNVVGLRFESANIIGVNSQGGIYSLVTNSNSIYTTMSNIRSLRMFGESNGFLSLCKREKKRLQYNTLKGSLNAIINKEARPTHEKYAPIKDGIRKEYKEINEQNKQLRNSLMNEKQNLETQLSKLSALKIKEKSQINAQLKDIEQQLSSMESEEALKKRFQDQLDAVIAEENSAVKEIADRIKAANPLPSFDDYIPDDL